MSKYLFILLLFCICKADCQPIVTDASNKRIMEWDSSYQIESKYFRADSNYEIAYYYSVKKQNKLVAEYFRHDDTSYLFVKYDTAEWIVQRGLLKYTNENFNCEKIEIHDWIRDPEGKLNIEKDTILCEGSFRKNGIWKETDSYGMIWKGQFNNGLRQGEWQEGYPYKVDYHSPPLPRMYDYFRPRITHNYIDGNEMPLYNRDDWQQLISKDWFYNSNQLKKSPNILLLSSYKDKIKWHFLPNSKIEITEPIGYNSIKIHKSKFTYKIVNDKLLMERNGDREVYQLVKIEGSEIILKILYDFVLKDELLTE